MTEFTTAATTFTVCVCPLVTGGKVVHRETCPMIPPHSHERAEARPTGDHPGESHTFRTTCERCGEPGQLFVALLGPDETATIAPRDALSAEETPEA